MRPGLLVGCRRKTAMLAQRDRGSTTDIGTPALDRVRECTQASAAVCTADDRRCSCGGQRRDLRCGSGSARRRYSRCSRMPISIANTNTRLDGCSAAAPSSAGAGHSPTNPQPMPNSALPHSSGPSICRWLGSCSDAPRSVRPRRRAHRNAGAATPMAPSITNPSDGSQRPATSRKPRTLVGSAMPESNRPVPKISPAIALLRTRFTQRPATWRAGHGWRSPRP